MNGQAYEFDAGALVVSTTAWNAICIANGFQSLDITINSIIANSSSSYNNLTINVTQGITLGTTFGYYMFAGMVSDFNIWSRCRFIESGWAEIFQRFFLNFLELKQNLIQQLQKKINTTNFSEILVFNGDKNTLNKNLKTCTTHCLGFDRKFRTIRFLKI
jgi:hypothetical protein